MFPGGDFCYDISNDLVTESPISYEDFDLATSNAQLRSSPYRKAAHSSTLYPGRPSSNDVSVLLECPVCMNLMHPPIFQVPSHIFHGAKTEYVICPLVLFRLAASVGADEQF